MAANQGRVRSGTPIKSGALMDTAVVKSKNVQSKGQFLQARHVSVLFLSLGKQSNLRGPVDQ